MQLTVGRQNEKTDDDFKSGAEESGKRMKRSQSKGAQDSECTRKKREREETEGREGRRDPTLPLSLSRLLFVCAFC